MAKNLDKESFENTVDVEITQESEPSVDVEFWQKESGLKQVELEIIKKEHPNNIDLELWQDEKEIINVEILNGFFGLKDLYHDETLKGDGTIDNKLGIAEQVLNKINTYVFDMATASDLWTIEHNLDKYPSVSVVDSGGNIVCGIVHYIDKNSLTVEFNGAFTGKAYLN